MRDVDSPQATARDTGRQEVKRGAGSVERGDSEGTGGRGQESGEHGREEAQEARGGRGALRPVTRTGTKWR